jgi:hypothetical protein
MCKPASAVNNPGLNQGRSAPPPVSAVTGGGGGGGAGSTFPLPAQLEASAQAFKDVFDTNNATYHRMQGQFAVVGAMQEVLRGVIFGINNTALREELLDLMRGSGWSGLSNALRSSNVRVGQTYQNGLPAGHPDKSKPMGVLRSTSIVNITQAYKDATATARQLIADTSVPPADRAAAKQILDDVSGTGQWAYNAVNQWLGAPRIGPMLFDKVSLPRQAALFLNSLVMCGSAAQFTAKQLLNTRGIPPQSLPAFPFTTLTGLSEKDSRSTTENLMLNYEPARLQNAMQAATSILAAGGYLVAGCLSGKVYEAAKHPFPEHYILLFAVSGAQFLFWDPDVSVTNIQALGMRLGPAIGVLFYNTADPSKPKLSTGLDFADLSAVAPDGHHVDHPVRHRYQIVTLEKP